MDRERVACVRGARGLMDRRFAEPLDLDQMAAHAGFSKFHFARAFRDAYGETPRAYLTRRRFVLEWARPKPTCPT